MWFINDVIIMNFKITEWTTDKRKARKQSVQRFARDFKETLFGHAISWK